jgi:glutamyl/glutaminyl-tRNA synthetase
MIQTVQNSLKTIADVGDQITYFLGEVHTYDPEGVAKYFNTQTVPVLEEAVRVLESTVVFNEMTLEERFRAEAAFRGRKFADYVHPMRLAITGRMASPNLFELIEILGKGRCIVRLRRFIQMIKTSLGQQLIPPSR